MLLSALPALVYVGLVVYSLIDCLQTPHEELNRLPHPGWFAVIVLIPLLGPVSWIVAGRAQPGRRHQRASSGPHRADGYGWTAEGMAQHPIGPDDDPEFLAGLGNLNRAQREQQRLLTRQEEDRRRREEEHPGDGSDGAGAAGPERS